MFELVSQYAITPAQQAAVETLTAAYAADVKRQVLLGVTGSGKTFTMAHIIRALARPTLVLSPNKTLAAQLFQEFRGFFPGNRVGYFISYYDYYQPEAYIPQRNLYIAKEVSINPELERLRIEAARNLLETPFTVTVASVSAIYSMGSPEDFQAQKVGYSRHQTVERDGLARRFIDLGYERSGDFIEPGTFRIRGEMVELFPTGEENPVRLVLDGNRLDGIEVFDAITARPMKSLETVTIFPISYFHYQEDRIHQAIRSIRAEMDERCAYFTAEGKSDIARRLRDRTRFDLEMLEQYGRCGGIENYSRHLTGRQPGEPPYTLLDFFGDDYLVIIDESHITVPQLRGMYEGDQSRKRKLVDFGFRLPSALDNRPLSFSEISQRLEKVLYVSATPADFEIQDSAGQVTELLVRPTGLLDPVITVKKEAEPVEDLIGEVRSEIERGNRVLITTLTKKMSEKLAEFLAGRGIRCTYLHSEVKPLDRIKILAKLRAGDVDVLIGINLLREGLDLPEVALVAVLDADKEGYLRSDTALIQTFGRAARHENGRVILYTRKMTDSLRRAVGESERRRNTQIQYNRTHGITPRSIVKAVKNFHDDDYWIRKSREDVATDINDPEKLQREIERLEIDMKQKAAELDFKAATLLRDRIKDLKNVLLELL